MYYIIIDGKRYILKGGKLIPVEEPIEEEKEE